MPTISTRKRSDGEFSFRVKWRLGGVRTGGQQSETFTARSRAERFSAMVEENHHQWPEGWVKGIGFRSTDDAATSLPFTDVMNRYITQLTDVQGDSRDRYRGQVKTLAAYSCPHPTSGSGKNYQPFAKNFDEITADDVRQWANTFERAAKTKRNYLYALLAPAFTWAIERGFATENPCTGIKIGSRAKRTNKVRFLTEKQYAILRDNAPADIRDLLEITVATGMRFGEVTALMVDDVDLDAGTISIWKSWKRKDSADVEWRSDEIYLRMKREKMLKSKHEMRGHFMGAPKTAKSTRTIPVSDHAVDILRRLCEGREWDDMLFVSPTGRPLHQVDFYEDRWLQTQGAARAAGLRFGPRFHDLRHTHAVWLISAGVPLTLVQHRLGHESITTTSDVYGGFLPQTHDAVHAAMQGAMTRVNGTPGVEPEPEPVEQRPALRLVR